MAAPLTPHQPWEEQQQLLPCRFHLGRLQGVQEHHSAAQQHNRECHNSQGAKERLVSLSLGFQDCEVS